MLLTSMALFEEEAAREAKTLNLFCPGKMWDCYKIRTLWQNGRDFKTCPSVVSAHTHTGLVCHNAITSAP